jgi:hypothetical protein
MPVFPTFRHKRARASGGLATTVCTKTELLALQGSGDYTRSDLNLAYHVASDVFCITPPDAGTEKGGLIGANWKPMPGARWIAYQTDSAVISSVSAELSGNCNYYASNLNEFVLLNMDNSVIGWVTEGSRSSMSGTIKPLGNVTVLFKVEKQRQQIWEVWCGSSYKRITATLSLQNRCILTQSNQFFVFICTNAWWLNVSYSLCYTVASYLIWNNPMGIALKAILTILLCITTWVWCWLFSMTEFYLVSFIAVFCLVTIVTLPIQFLFQWILGWFIVPFSWFDLKLRFSLLNSSTCLICFRWKLLGHVHPLVCICQERMGLPNTLTEDELETVRKFEKETSIKRTAKMLKMSPNLVPLASWQFIPPPVLSVDGDLVENYKNHHNFCPIYLCFRPSTQENLLEESKRLSQKILECKEYDNKFWYKVYYNQLTWVNSKLRLINDKSLSAKFSWAISTYWLIWVSKINSMHSAKLLAFLMFVIMSISCATQVMAFPNSFSGPPIANFMDDIYENTPIFSIAGVNRTCLNPSEGMIFDWTVVSIGCSETNCLLAVSRNIDTLFWFCGQIDPGSYYNLITNPNTTATVIQSGQVSYHCYPDWMVFSLVTEHIVFGENTYQSIIGAMSQDQAHNDLSDIRDCDWSFSLSVLSCTTPGCNPCFASSEYSCALPVLPRLTRSGPNCDQVFPVFEANSTGITVPETVKDEIALFSHWGFSSDGTQYLLYVQSIELNPTLCFYNPQLVPSSAQLNPCYQYYDFVLFWNNVASGTTYFDLTASVSDQLDFQLCLTNLYMNSPVDSPIVIPSGLNLPGVLPGSYSSSMTLISQQYLLPGQVTYNSLSIATRTMNTTNSTAAEIAAPFFPTRTILPITQNHQFSFYMGLINTQLALGPIIQIAMAFSVSPSIALVFSLFSMLYFCTALQINPTANTTLYGTWPISSTASVTPGQIIEANFGAIGTLKSLNIEYASATKTFDTITLNPEEVKLNTELSSPVSSGWTGVQTIQNNGKPLRMRVHVVSFTYEHKVEYQYSTVGTRKGSSQDDNDPQSWYRGNLAEIAVGAQCQGGDSQAWQHALAEACKSLKDLSFSTMWPYDPCPYSNIDQLGKDIFSAQQKADDNTCNGHWFVYLVPNIWTCNTFKLAQARSAHIYKVISTRSKLEFCADVDNKGTCFEVFDDNTDSAGGTSLTRFSYIFTSPHNPVLKIGDIFASIGSMFFTGDIAGRGQTQENKFGCPQVYYNSRVTIPLTINGALSCNGIQIIQPNDAICQASVSKIVGIPKRSGNIVSAPYSTWDIVQTLTRVIAKVVSLDTVSEEANGGLLTAKFVIPKAALQTLTADEQLNALSLNAQTVTSDNPKISACLRCPLGSLITASVTSKYGMRVSLTSSGNINLRTWAYQIEQGHNDFQTVVDMTGTGESWVELVLSSSLRWRIAFGIVVPVNNVTGIERATPEVVLVTHNSQAGGDFDTTGLGKTLVDTGTAVASIIKRGSVFGFMDDIDGIGKTASTIIYVIIGVAILVGLVFALYTFRPYFQACFAPKSPSHEVAQHGSELESLSESSKPETNSISSTDPELHYHKTLTNNPQDMSKPEPYPSEDNGNIKQGKQKFGKEKEKKRTSAVMRLFQRWNASSKMD